MSTTLQPRGRVVAVILYAAANVQPRLTSAILVMIYARVFSLSEFGVYGVLVSLTVILGIVADLGLPSAILRNYYDRHDDPKSAATYLSSVLRGSRVLALCMIPAIGLALYLMWDLAGIGRALIWYFLPILLGVSYFDRSSEILAAICRAIERPDFHAIGRTMQGLASIAAGVVLVVVFDGGVVGAMVGLLVSRSVASVAYLFLLSKTIAFGSKGAGWAELRGCLAFGLPLVPNQIAAWLRQPALRPLLAHIVSLSQVGLFSLASSVASLPLILSSAVDFALSPVYFRRRVSMTPDFRAKIVTFAEIQLAVLFPVWMFAILFCSNIVHAFASGRFHEAVPTCAALFCAAFARFQHPFFIRQIEFLRNTWVMPLVTGSGTALAIVLTLTLAGQYGIIASAWAVTLSDAAILFGLAWAVGRRENVDYPMGMSFLLLVILAIAAIWSGMGEPFPLIAVPRLAAKIAIFGFSVLASGTIWIWPRREFIERLVRG